MKKFTALSFSLVMLLTPINGVPTEASTHISDRVDNSDINLENYTVIELSESTDNDFKIALEISESDLEENSIFKNGSYKNFYKNHNKAQVSKEAFDIFNENLNTINKWLKSGEFETSGSLLDIQPVLDVSNETEDNIIQPFASLEKVWYGWILSISGTEATKIQKVLAAGGGIAGLLAIPAINVLGGTWAAVIFALYGVGEICNWNNKGYYIHSANIPGFALKPIWCTAK